MTESKFRFTALKFCVFLAGVFGLQLFYGFEPGFNASSSAWWKFFTAPLGHSGLDHLSNNLFFIGLFGSIYERYTSGKTFLLTFVAAALFANLTAFIFFPTSTVIGASGGAFGILAALAVMKPDQIGLVLGVPLPMWAVLGIYTFINLAGITGASNTAHEAHLFGMLVGGIVGFYLIDEEEKQGEQTEDEDPEVSNWREKIQQWEEKWMM
jgi:membrane associated rhomboid family serine protease